MMNFSIIGINCRKYALLHENKEIACLDYKGWSSVKSEISLINGEIFTLDGTSMWKSKFQLKREQKVVLDYEMSWKGHFLIHSKFDGVQQNLTFKSKEFWGNRYVLMDEKENQLVEITPKFSWKGFKTEYVVETTPDFDNQIQKDVLLLVLIHCIRYYMAIAIAVT